MTGTLGLQGGSMGQRTLEIMVQKDAVDHLLHPMEHVRSVIRS